MTLLILAISLPLLAVLALVFLFRLWRPQMAWAAGNSTSTLGAAIAVEGLLFQIGNGQSPETFWTVANVSDVSLPLGAKTVDVTNVGNNWMAEIPTLLQYGKMQIKVFWVMEEQTHRNSAASNIRGLRYLMFNKILCDIGLVYPDGNNSTDAFKGYVTGFKIDGKVAGVFEATVELSGNDQNPSFV